MVQYSAIGRSKGRVGRDVVGGTERYIETVGILVRLGHDPWLVWCSEIINRARDL